MNKKNFIFVNIVFLLITMNVNSQNSTTSMTKTYNETIKKDSITVSQGLIDSIKVYLSLNPDNSDMWGALVFAYMNKGDTEEALASCKKWISIKPNDASAYLYMGMLFYQPKNSTLCIKALETYISLVQNTDINMDVYSLLSFYYHNEENYSKAITYKKKYIQSQPDNADEYVELAYLYLANNDIENAIDALLKADKLGNKQAADALKLIFQKF